MEEDKSDAHRAKLAQDRVKYTTQKDLGASGDRNLIQSASLAFNSTFSLNGFERNFYFENRGDGFDELGAVSGIDSDIDARSFGIGDLDGDGDLDLVIKNLQRRLLQCYLNEIPANGRHRVFFRLTGTESNRDAIGARVEIRHGEDGFQMAEVRSANGFQSQSARELFFGLGPDDEIRRVDVFWPSGKRESFEKLAAGHVYSLREGEGITQSKAIAPGKQPELASDSRAAVPKQTFFEKKRKAPQFTDRDIEGRPVASATLYESTVLASFVKTWLPDFDEHLALLAKIDATHDDLEVVVFLVEPADDDKVEKARKTGLRVVRTVYGRYAPAFAQQTNMLFPSTFLVEKGEVVFDMIGALDETKTMEALANKLE